MKVLGTNRLDIHIEVSEVVVVSSTIAYTPSRSAETTTNLANNAQGSRDDQELLVLVCSENGGAWRTSCCIFSTIVP